MGFIIQGYIGEENEPDNEILLGLFLIMFMVVTSAGVLSGFLSVLSAQNTHAAIISELEDSDFYPSVVNECFKKAKDENTCLSIKLYLDDNSVKTISGAGEIPGGKKIEKARVELKFLSDTFFEIKRTAYFKWITHYKL